jgi:hypothetical protein
MLSHRVEIIGRMASFEMKELEHWHPDGTIDIRNFIIEILVPRPPV